MATPAACDIRQALEQATGLLAELPDARREAEWLLMDTLPCSRAWLFSHGDQTLEQQCWRQFLEKVERRAAGEPLAYVLGHCDFRDLKLMVSPAVLIPRPETEWLVEEVLRQLPGEALQVADLGTGSGAIALSLAWDRPRWQLWATDISARALDVARRNAAALGLESVRFLQGSWFEVLPGGQRFDAVVSNPPYVEPGAAALDDAVARHEPELALYAGLRGMAVLQHLIAEASTRLRPDGLLALEHGHEQGAAVRDRMQVAGYQAIRTHRDLGGHERFTVARWREQSHA
ncbi:MAG: peptide chain release factor N(5)-glutamine methyltransferase [Pseudohongiellaceae bacterium]